MTRKYFAAFIGFLLIGGSALAEAPRFPLLSVPQIETLPNGLEVVWFLSDKLPVVDMVLMVKTGHQGDPQGKSGTAELVSSLLDRGAAGMNARQIARAVEMLGATRFVSADEDSFSMGMHGLAPDAVTLLDLLGKLVLQPDFPPSEVAREHARILDRWSHIGDYGETLASIAYHRVLSAGTAYGRGSFLSEAEFKNVGREDVVAFHRSHFTPKNSIFMVVGRVDQAEFRKRILAVFGGWQGEAPARDSKTYADRRLVPSHAKGPLKRGPILLVDRPGLTQAQIRIGFRAPPIKSPEHYGLVVGNALLGEYFNSRLNSLIRDKLGLTYSISSGFSYSKELAGFTISSTTRNETVGQLIRKTLDVLKNLKRGPITVEEVQTAKDFLEGGFPLSTATLGAVASRWLAGYIFDLGPGYLNEFIPKVHAVTKDEVFAAVAKHFDLDHLAIVVAGDAKEIEKGLAEARVGAVKRVLVNDLM